MRFRGTFVVCVLGVAMTQVPLRVALADEPSREYVVKAAFVYKFTQFVEWPQSAFSSGNAPFVVAVIGPDPFNGALENTVSGKTVGDHPVVFKHFENADEISPCELLFVPADEDPELDEIFQKVNGKPILTVGEDDAFIQNGGIRFYTVEAENRKLRFEINLDSIKAASLKVSAKLANLARIFHK